MTADLMKSDMCACFNIRRAARKVTQTYDRILKPSGLLATQFSLLATLSGHGGENGVAMTALAGHLGMDRTTLTRNLTLAVRAGWVETTIGKDQRARLVRLTPGGQARLDEAIPYWREAQAQVIDRIGENGLAKLVGLTRSLESG